MSRPLILVVDDDTDVRDFVADVLRLEDYAVDTATNGREALTLLEQQSYDLVVSNMRMPELDGPSLYYEVKQRRPEATPPFLFLTGDYEKPDYVRFFQEARVPALAKPCSPATLIQAVKPMLRVDR